jgi:hypothetical protein
MLTIHPDLYEDSKKTACSQQDSDLVASFTSLEITDEYLNGMLQFR